MQGLQLLALPANVQKKPLSITHKEEHPSPFAVFPSSHCSGDITFASPQNPPQLLSTREIPLAQAEQMSVLLTTEQLRQLKIEEQLITQDVDT